MRRKTSVLLLVAFIAAPAIAQVPAVKRTGVRAAQAVLQSLDTEYDAYQTQLDAHKQLVIAEQAAYNDLLQKDAELAAAQTARDNAQSALDTARAATDQALADTTAAHAAVRPSTR